MILPPLSWRYSEVPRDHSLIERLKNRDPQALAELYDRYGGLAYSLILRVVRDNAIAEDLVQETFLRGMESHSLHRFREGAPSGRGKILAIARNGAIDYLRLIGRA